MRGTVLSRDTRTGCYCRRIALVGLLLYVLVLAAFGAHVAGKRRPGLGTFQVAVDSTFSAINKGLRSASVGVKSLLVQDKRGRRAVADKEIEIAPGEEPREANDSGDSTPNVGDDDTLPNGSVVAGSSIPGNEGKGVILVEAHDSPQQAETDAAKASAAEAAADSERIASAEKAQRDVEASEKAKFRAEAAEKAARVAAEEAARAAAAEKARVDSEAQAAAAARAAEVKAAQLATAAVANAGDVAASPTPSTLPWPTALPGDTIIDSRSLKMTTRWALPGEYGPGETAFVTMAAGNEAARLSIAMIQSLRDVGTSLDHDIIVLLVRGGVASPECHDPAWKKAAGREHIKCHESNTIAEEIISPPYVETLKRLGAKPTVVDPVTRTEFTAGIPGGMASFWGMSLNRCVCWQSSVAQRPHLDARG